MPIFKKFWTDRRFRKIITLFFRFLVQLWWNSKTKSLVSEEKYKSRSSALYSKQARLYTETATELGGLLIKLGQFFSARVDILPDEYTSELAKLQDAVRPVPTEGIIKRIEEEHKRPLAEVYANFSTEPLAAASLGQVHIGEIGSGRKVAVKVLRPGIEAVLQTDFEALQVMIRFAERYPKIQAAVDLEKVYQEFVETTEDELDYLKEGRHSELFRENFRGNPKVYVPEVFWEYTTQRVLTMEYVQGIKINEFSALDGAGVDRVKLADRLISTYVQQFLHDGFFHADPHPGNLLVKDDGTLVFLDFGMVGRIDGEMKESLIELVIAVFKKDVEQMISAFEKLGFLRPQANKQTLAKALQFTLAALFEQKEINRNNMDEFLLEIREFMYAQPFQLPAHTLFLGKTLITIIGLCYGLNPEIDLVQSLKPYADQLFKGKDGRDGRKSFVGNMIFDQVKKTFAEGVTLPEKVNRLIAGLETGEIRIQPSRSFEANLIQSQQEQGNRLVRAVLSGAFLVAGAVLTEGEHAWLGFTLMIIAVLVMFSLMKSKRKRRRRHGQMMSEEAGFQKPKFHP